MASLVLAAACAPGSGEVPSDARRFAFRAERVPVGTVFHYTKSNIDGTRPIGVTVFVADTARLEMLEFELDGRATVLVGIQLDWTTFSAARIESWQLAPDGSRSLRVQASLTADGRFMAEAGGTRDTVEVGQYPVHLYNLGLVTLAGLFPHLHDPEGGFTIGVLSPRFGAGPGLASFRGVATVRFTGEVPCHAALCRRYEITGPGVGGAPGAIWVRHDDAVVENIEIPSPTHREWRDFKLELRSSERMTPDAWAAWITAAASAP